MMISIENPSPKPPCSCEILPLKSSEERACDNPQQLELDVYKSGLDYDKNNKSPLPLFCIRDYAFNTRSNDIKINWPFSRKKLELCLKQGMADLLPPFQSLDSMRNPSIENCAVESIFRDKENISNYDTKDHLVTVSSSNVGYFYQKLEVDCENINSSGSEVDKEFPSTTTCQSCFGIESVSTIKGPCLEPKAENWPGPSVKKAESAIPIVKKIVQTPVKKCQLILKLSNITDWRPNNDLVANTSKVSETMASQVCPVCKNFSSFSHTTLNAHIVQCLSGESTIRWMGNSKVSKQRIKPRKTRLMEDIYATSPHCTLEELDRRNYSSNLDFPAQNTETCTEGKDMTSSPVNFEDTNEEGKLRRLQWHKSSHSVQ